MKLKRRGDGLAGIVANVVSHVVVWGGALLILLPFIWMLLTSFKQPAAVFEYPPRWIPKPFVIGNYTEALNALPFNRFLLNTAFVATLVVLGQVISCSLGAFAFAKLRFPGSDLLFSMYLATLMVPEIVTIIPNFVLMRFLHWIDTYQALIVPSFFGTAFGTFFLRQFFLTFPDELLDAAKIDGCGVLTTIYRIVIPLSKPALVSLAIFVLVKVWNDFMWPLTVINSTEKKTLAIGLASFQGLIVSNWGVIMAGAVYTMLPLVAMFVFAQRYFIQGIALTGMK